MADKYAITNVQQQIEECIKPNISKENVVKVLTVADMLHLEDIKSKAIDFIRTGNYDKLADVNGISNASAAVVLMIVETLDATFRCRIPVA